MKGKPNEDLLHYVWRVKYFDSRNLKSTINQNLRILSFGHYNRNAGPDFLDAKIELDGLLWVGHIEMHVKSSDWNLHGHTSDLRYQNVILHVVYEEDESIFLRDGSRLPCVTLKNRIPKKALNKYYELKKASSWIPCGSLIHLAPEHIIQQTKAAFLVERLKERAVSFIRDLEDREADLLELLYHKLAWAFGLSVNADAFETLVKTLPLSLVSRHKDNLLQLEAFLFGQSGLLPEQDNHPYIQNLKTEYAFLASKYSLKPMKPIEWKFMRMRPAGFPTIRLAQFAKFLYHVNRFDLLLLKGNLKDIYNAFYVETGGYWLDHYRFGQQSVAKTKRLGKAKIDAVIINVCAPMLFVYSMRTGDHSHKEKALALLSFITPEDNRVIRKWRKLGIQCEHAGDSQALLELKKNRCDAFGCLTCPVGHHLIKNS